MNQDDSVSEDPTKPTIPSKKSNYPSSGVGAGMDRSVYVDDGSDGEESKSGRHSGKRSTAATITIVVAVSAAIVGIVALSMYCGLLP